MICELFPAKMCWLWSTRLHKRFDKSVTSCQPDNSRLTWFQSLAKGTMNEWGTCDKPSSSVGCYANLPYWICNL